MSDSNVEPAPRAATTASNDARRHAEVSRRDFIGGSSAIAAAAATATTSAVLAQPPRSDEQTKPAARASLKKAKAAVKDLEKTIIKISREVWEKAAVGMHEQEAMEVHIRELTAAGFRIISRNSGGHPTAFIAEWSQGGAGPKVGFLPEYDALPGLGNAAESKMKPAPNGKTDGHGCGHNCLGAGCTGAAIALKAIMGNERIPGAVRVYGCGAEEVLGAKVFMAKAGLFDDLDVALAWHSAPVPVTGTIVTSANRKIKVSWTGKTAHAGNTPWDGRSALDAAELFAHGVNLMREHVEPTARLHYIYEVAGVAPNVVPDQARIWLVARDITSGKVDAITDWLRQLADGAALGTQTKATFDLLIGLAELMPNEVLATRVLEHMRNTPLEWTDEEHAFAKRCQRELGLKETGMATHVMPFIKDKTVGGSTDVADISWIVPVGLFGWPTLPLGVSLHTWPVTACGGMSIGDKGTLSAAAILAAVGLDFMTEPELRAKAKEELKTRLGGRKHNAVLDIDAIIRDEPDKRFGKGPGEEIVSGIDES